MANTSKPSHVSRVGEGLRSPNRVDRHHDTYSVEIDSVSQEKWHEILQIFSDSTLMQTWSYGCVRWGGKNLSHVLLRKGGNIVAASQVNIFKAPLLPFGLANVRRGPCWQVKGRPKDLETFRRMLQVLYQTYAVERGLLVRIVSNEIEDVTGTLHAILEEEGFHRDPDGIPAQTLIMDLSYPLEELRRSLKRKWRRNLVLAERHNLTIASGVDDKIFQDLMTIYAEMRVRKKWEPVADGRYLARVQSALPPPLKMMCMNCLHNGQSVSGAAISKIGNTARLMLAATGNKGLDLRSSYLLQWRVLEWLKSSNVRWYDLCGINHLGQPGVAQFKSGLAGKLGLELDYLGVHLARNHPVTRFSVQAAERSRETLINLKRAYGRLQGGAVETS